jgi:hypothetical protein
VVDVLLFFVFVENENSQISKQMFLQWNRSIMGMLCVLIVKLVVVVVVVLC